MSWQFKPKLIPTVAVIILFPILLALGFWQLNRADQKAALYAQYQVRRHLAPLNLNTAAVASTDDLLWRSVSVQGIFDGTNYLLDNQVLNGDAGYFVYTPFRLVPGEKRALVNRGWVRIGADRARLPRLPTPAGLIHIEGVIKEPPRTGILLSNNTWEEPGSGVVRVQNIDMGAIAKKAGHTFLPFIVRLNAASDAGFTRHWIDPGSGRVMHLGYAFQWFLLSAVLVVIYLTVNLKKKSQSHA